MFCLWGAERCTPGQFKPNECIVWWPIGISHRPFKNPGSAPDNVITATYIHCLLFLRWWKGPWQKCSKTCGKGISIRSVLCVRSSGNDEQVALKDETCAKIREKPPVVRSCERKTCPLAWTVGNWSEVFTKYETVKCNPELSKFVNPGEQNEN